MYKRVMRIKYNWVLFLKKDLTGLNKKKKVAFKFEV